MSNLKYEVEKEFEIGKNKYFGYVCYLFVFSEKPLNQIDDNKANFLFFADKRDFKNAIQWRFTNESEVTLSEQVELKIKEIKKILGCEPEGTSSVFR
jgi:hypothetical protein